MTIFGAPDASRPVVIVSHRERRVTVHRREDGGWATLEASMGETLALESIGARVAVDVIYRGRLEDVEPAA